MQIEGRSLALVQDKIILPEEFDKSYQATHRFQDDIAGYTTFSFSHFKSGFDKAFDVKTYRDMRIVGDNDHINCHLHWQTYRLLFPDKEIRYRKNGDPYYITPQDNRRYVTEWINHEVYQEMNGSDYLLDFDFHDVIYQARGFIDHAESFDDIITMLSPDLRFKCFAYFRKYMNNDFDYFREFMAQIRQRKGLQVVYGNREEFTTFVASLDQNDWGKNLDPCALSLKVNIPGDLVKFVVP